MIIQKGSTLVLTIMMLASSVSAAENSFIKFKSGGSENAVIASWTKRKIKVVNDKGRTNFYYYAEIESIDGTLMEDMKTYKAFMTLWSSVRHRMTNFRMGFQKEKQAYDKDGNIFKNQRELCEDSKREKIIKIYNKKGVLMKERTCVGGEKKKDRMYYANGAIQRILFFENNAIVAVQRYTRTGEPVQPGDLIEK